MTAPLKIERRDEIAVPRVHYEGVARDALLTLWHRRLPIAGLVIAALLLASIALVLTGPRYTSEAIIQLNFIREEPATGVKIQPIAAVDAVALVDSAARVIRSRATSGAVVARKGLDKDPDFAREPMLWRVLSAVRATLGLEGTPPTQRDLAVSQLMRMVTVTNDPRSYLISVAITSGDPERAANLANAIALEYLRGQLMQQLADSQAAIERDLAQLASIYGVRHPNYAIGRARLENLQARLSALRDGALADDAVRLVIGQSLVAAEKVLVPTGPNIMLILRLSAGAALAAGIWLALLLRPERPGRSDGLAVVVERPRELARE
jgi:uncharacterized protein involved in exopolysaccharide biosynthesis